MLLPRDVSPALPSNVPADIAHAYEVGNVPPGITPEFLMESRDGPTKAAIYFLFFLTMAFMLGRCYSRIFVVRKFGLDDWLACVTFVRFPCFALGLSRPGRVQLDLGVLGADYYTMTDCLHSHSRLLHYLHRQWQRQAQRLRALRHVAQ